MNFSRLMTLGVNPPILGAKLALVLSKIFPAIKITGDHTNMRDLSNILREYSSEDVNLQFYIDKDTIIYDRNVISPRQFRDNLFSIDELVGSPTATDNRAPLTRQIVISLIVNKSTIYQCVYRSDIGYQARKAREWFEQVRELLALCTENLDISIIEESWINYHKLIPMVEENKKDIHTKQFMDKLRDYLEDAHFTTTAKHLRKTNLSDPEWRRFILVLLEYSQNDPIQPIEPIPPKLRDEIKSRICAWENKLIHLFFRRD